MAPIENCIIAELVGGSESAFQKIFDRYSPRILRLGMKFFDSEEAAMDFVQDVFINVWTKREKFRKVENFETFVWILARNLALSKRRHMARQQLRIEEFLRDHAQTQNNVDQYINAR